jgi:AraC-like DNA-binding protein
MKRLRAIDLVRPTKPGPSVQAWLLPHLIAWVEEQGIDASPIRKLPGMADLTDPDLRVPEASVEAAWRLAATLTRDEAIGVHLAEWLPRGALDLVEYAFRSSASLATGLERLARYGRVLSDRVAARMDALGEEFLLLFRDTGSTALHPGRAEFALAAALKLARESTGHDITPLQVRFGHAAPPDEMEYRRFFRGPVRFGAGSTSMILSRLDAARPLLGADAALSSIVRRRLDKALAERDLHDAGPFSGRVRRLIVEHLGGPTVTPPGVARALGVSRRTLSRRLAGEGTSFRDILNDVRREFACALLQDRSVSVGDIAFFLQYSEPAAFHRAFRRWTGRTAGDFRASLIGQPPHPDVQSARS